MADERKDESVQPTTQQERITRDLRESQGNERKSQIVRQAQEILKAKKKDG
jgi:hypothetical protein